MTPRPIAPDTVLMCSATIDRPVGEWLVDFVRVLGPTADAIWSHSAGWPEQADRQIDWLSAHRVHSALSFATWDVPASEISGTTLHNYTHTSSDSYLRAQGLDARAARRVPRGARPMIRGVRWQRGPDPGGVVPGKVQGNVLRPYGYPVLDPRLRADRFSLRGARRARRAHPSGDSGCALDREPTIDAQHLVHVPRPRRTRSPKSAPRLLSPTWFRQGMAARAATLGDTGRSDPSQWEEGLGTGDAHVLFTIHATSAEDERAR